MLLKTGVRQQVPSFARIRLTYSLEMVQEWLYTILKSTIANNNPNVKGLLRININKGKTEN